MCYDNYCSFCGAGMPDRVGRDFSNRDVRILDPLGYTLRAAWYGRGGEGNIIRYPLPICLLVNNEFQCGCDILYMSSPQPTSVVTLRAGAPHTRAPTPQGDNEGDSKEEMDVAGFRDALCWGNRLAVVDPTVRYATRTSLSLMHCDRFSTVVSRWLTESPSNVPTRINSRRREPRSTATCNRYSEDN